MRKVLYAIGSLVLMAGTASAADPRTPFRDCRSCPEMVRIPAGRFLMGSPVSDRAGDASERPWHEVTIRHPFAVGRYEILRGEWAEFVRATHQSDPEGCNIHQAAVPHWPTVAGLNWHNPGFAQTDRHPALCMSWNEATAYTKWLSRKTGHHYRLLSEAEWEYAARAGSRGPHYWGENPRAACLYANGSDRTRRGRFPEWQADQPCRDGYVFTSPAGRFRPNAFGLYDMLGNVAEMTEDCWEPNYVSAPRDGSAWHAGNCTRRVNRGDTWTSTPGGLRSASRGFDDADLTRVVDLGFRVARDR